MKIETKFEIGDYVWVIDNMSHESPCECCHRLWSTRKWVVLDRRRIRGVNVQKITEYEERYFMESRDGDTFAYKGLDEIFITELEAQAECKKRNEEAE